MAYEDHFYPLESDPDIFTELARRLGARANVLFEEVYSLDEALLLPRNAAAIIVLFPTSDDYEQRLEVEKQLYSDAARPQHPRWFKQKVNNACGLYALLHAICNTDTTKTIGQ